MPRLRFVHYVLLVAGAALVFAAFSPSRTSLAVALAVFGGAAAVLVGWAIVAIAGDVPRRQGRANGPRTTADDSPEAASGNTEQVAEGTDPLVGLGDTVRDRLRLLLLLPRPLDSQSADEPARVGWQRLTSALKKDGSDCEVSTVWPPTVAALQHCLLEQPHQHLAVIEASPMGDGVALEDPLGRTSPVTAKGLASLIGAQGKVRLLVLRLTGEGSVPVDELLRNGLETVVTVPPGLAPERWVDLLALIVRSLSQGDVMARTVTTATAYLDRLELPSRERPVFSGSNWYSVVDRGSDAKGLRVINHPYVPELRQQLWFRDHGEPSCRLLEAIGTGARVVAATGQPGIGVTSLGIEAAHRLAGRFAHVIMADCAALGHATAVSVLAEFAQQLRLRVPREAALSDGIRARLGSQPALLLVARADLLASEERQPLVTFSQDLGEGSCLLFLASSPISEGGLSVAVGPLDTQGAIHWLSWLAENEGFNVLEEVSRDSVEALVRALDGNPLAIRLSVGLSDHLGLLQSIRTARNIGSLDGLLELTLSRLGLRDLEAASVLALLPGPLTPALVGAALNRDAIPSLVRLERAGLTSQGLHPLGYQLHPCVRQAVAKRSPAGDRLVRAVAEAAAGQARSLSKSLLAAEDAEMKEGARQELLLLAGALRLVAEWTGGESGPAAGRMDLLRDVTVGLVPLLRDVGLVYEALNLAQAGEEAARRLEDFGARGVLLVEVAEAHREAVEVALAASAYEEAARAFEQAKDLRRAADALVNLGAMRWESDDLAGARAPLERALSLLEHLQDVKGQASALVVLAQIARACSDNGALALYERALGLVRTLPDAKLEEAQVYYALGRLRAEAGDYGTAAADYAHAVEGFTAVGDSQGRTQAYRALGRVYLKLDDRARAVQVLERAAEIEERTAVGIDAALDLGRAYMRDRRWSEALDYHRRAVARASSAGDKRAMAQAQNGLGSTHLEQGDRAQAVRAFEESARLWKELEDEVGLGRTYNNLAVAYRRAGRWDVARQYLDEAATYLERGGDKDALASVYNNTGLILAAQRKEREAAKYYERSLALKESLGDLYGANITKLNLQALTRRD